MIKILIVDDSNTEILILQTLFESEPDIKVIGCARSGPEAIKLAASLKPDLITMDIMMPGMNGFETIRNIMSHTPIPIVVISSRINSGDLTATFQALENGAVSVLEKPTDISADGFEKMRKRMITTLRTMS